jgi:hypothetical protein
MNETLPAMVDCGSTGNQRSYFSLIHRQTVLGTSLYEVGTQLGTIERIAA